MSRSINLIRFCIGPHVSLRVSHLLALLACVIACFSSNATGADPRFGDSTWVAPVMPIVGDPGSAGPRVAEPDRERAWETALRTPFRVVFLPLRFLARGMEAGVGHFGGKFLDPKPKEAPRPGLALGPHVDLSGASDGLGGIGAGPALTWTGFPTADSRMVASGTMSINDRRRARLRGVVGDRRLVGLLLRVDYEYRPDRSYYGIGNDARESDRAYYRLETTSAEAGLFYGASPLRRVRLLGGYSGISPGRGYHGSPLLDDVFTPGSVPYDRVATRVLTYGIAGDLATLDDLAVPSLGLHGRAELRQAAGMRGIDPDYTQWLVEGRAYVPVFAHRRVLALRALYTGVDPTGSTSVLPFYRLPVTENPFRLVGYASQRFRDRQLILCRIEYRWIIGRNLSAVALYELSEVAFERRAFTLRSMHSAWGGGLRLGMNDATAARLELGKSVEGLHAVLRFASDF